MSKRAHRRRRRAATIRQLRAIMRNAAKRGQRHQGTMCLDWVLAFGDWSEAHDRLRRLPRP